MIIWLGLLGFVLCYHIGQNVLKVSAFCTCYHALWKTAVDTINQQQIND